MDEILEDEAQEFIKKVIFTNDYQNQVFFK
jgi:hypothetical protein